MTLTAQQIEEFHRVGFIVLKNFWSSEAVAEMRAAFERLYAVAQKLKTTQMYHGSSFVLNDRGTSVAVARVVWAGAAEPCLLKYGAEPRLLSMVSQLLGSQEMDQLINQAHFKVPGDGVAFPWHQDIQHRDKKPGDWSDVNGQGSYVQTLTCLDDMTRDNGPVLFIPGSSQRGLLNLRSAPDYAESEYVEYRASRGTSEIVDDSQAVVAEAPSGSVVLFGPYTVHGSFPNHSKQTRFTFINGYAYPGANRRVYPGEGSGRRLKAPAPAQSASARV